LSDTRPAGVAGAFDDFSFDILGEVDVEAIDLRNDVFGGDEEFGVGGAAGSFVDLVRGVGFEDDECRRRWNSLRSGSQAAEER